jgi:polygalacturonase
VAQSAQHLPSGLHYGLPHAVSTHKLKLTLFPELSPIQSVQFSVDTYGAVPDGVTNSTAAFHAAAAAVARHGAGAELVAPGPGTYMTMPFEVMSSGTMLRIAEGATVKAICDLDHWPKVKEFPS